MDRSQATSDSFDAVRVELPSGKTVECRALTVKEAVRFIRMLDEAGTHEDDVVRSNAQVAFLDEFPRAVGLDDERLAPAEVFELSRRFFRLLSWSSTAQEKTTERAGQSSTPDSMT